MLSSIAASIRRLISGAVWLRTRPSVVGSMAYSGAAKPKTRRTALKFRRGVGAVLNPPTAFPGARRWLRGTRSGFEARPYQGRSSEHVPAHCARNGSDAGVRTAVAGQHDPLEAGAQRRQRIARIVPAIHDRLDREIRKLGARGLDQRPEIADAEIGSRTRRACEQDAARALARRRERGARL